MIYYVLMGIALFAVLGAVVSHRRAGVRAPHLPPQAVASSEAIESTPHSFDGARSGPQRTATSRDVRAMQIEARARTCLCLYCDRPASRQVPQLRLIRPTFDALYRWANVVPINRWKLELEPDISVPHLVCEQHHAIARSHLEARIAKSQVEYAAFVEGQRDALYEFESYALDERMARDAERIRGALDIVATEPRSKKVPKRGLRAVRDAS